jgi:hypothetical protein
VRGGLSAKPGEILEQARADYEEDYKRDWGLVLSVQRVDLSEHQDREAALCALSKEAELRNKQLRTAAWSSIAELDLPIVHAPPPNCHWEVALGIDEPEVHLERVLALFAEAEKNPCPSKKQ